MSVKTSNDSWGSFSPAGKKVEVVQCKICSATLSANGISLYICEHLTPKQDDSKPLNSITHHEAGLHGICDESMPCHTPKESFWIEHAGYLHYATCAFPTVDQAVCNCPTMVATKNARAFVEGVLSQQRELILSVAPEEMKCECVVEDDGSGCDCSGFNKGVEEYKTKILELKI